ncbi:MAG: CHRD domain-containing protein [Byssovorax sp.]
MIDLKLRTTLLFGIVAPLALTGCSNKDSGAHPATTAPAAHGSAPATTSGAPTVFDHLTLTGQEEVPNFDSSGAGTAKVTVAGTGDTATITVVVTLSTMPNSKITSASIYLGARGAIGPEAFSIGTVPTPAGGKVLHKADLRSTAGKSFSDVIAEIRAGRAYLNIITENNSSGELRAQIK